MISLELYKKYTIKTCAGTYTFKINKDQCGYFLHFLTCHNDILFSIYGINQKEFTKKILGYYNGGTWPYSNSQEECEILLFNLLNKINKNMDPYISYDFCNNLNCWND